MVIELDGKEYHKGTRDLWRDAFILGEKKCDFIIRFTGKDIVYNLSECLYLLLKLHPEYFSNRSLQNIPNLLDGDNKSEIDKKLSENEFEILDLLYFDFVYVNDRLEREKTNFTSKYLKQPNGYWIKYFDFAHKNNLFTIEQLDKKNITDLV